MDSYNLELLTADNINDLNSLFKAAFNVSPVLGFMQWKYFDNPKGNAIVAGVFFNAKLVASGAMIPEELTYQNKRFVVYKCTDLMTDPKHQRKGLSKKVSKLLNEQTKKTNPPFFYTLCSNISTKSFLKNDWIFLEHVTNFFKPYLFLRISNLLSKKRLENIRFYDNVSNHLDEYHFTINPAKFQIYKTANYIKWRTSNPDFTYKMVCSYSEDNKINGYLIYSLSRNNLINIIDIEALHEDSKILKRLVKSVELQVVNKKYKGLFTIAIKGTTFYHFISNQKYLRNPFKKGLLRSILDFDIYINDRTFATSIQRIERWDIKGINYDDI